MKSFKEIMEKEELTRSDYKLNPSGRKSHKYITMNSAAGEKEEDKEDDEKKMKEVKEETEEQADDRKMQLKKFKDLMTPGQICPNCAVDPCICDDSHGFVKEGANDHYADAETHKNKASKALETSDMAGHHLHMSNHHEAMGRWHDDKGRHSSADREYAKAEDHHEKGLAASKVPSRSLKSEEFEIDEATDKVTQRRILAQKQRLAVGAIAKEAAKRRELERKQSLARSKRISEAELDEAAQGHTIEAHGIRGMKATPWRKTFKNHEHLEKWADANDSVEVHATRDLEQAKKGNLSPAMKEESEINEMFNMLAEAATSIDKGEYDYEGQMARTQLQTTMRNCEDLIDMIEDDENMPEWVQSKITLAQDYITTVRDYLQSKEELGEQAPVAPSLGVHRVAVTTSEPDHPMVSKRKETTQRFVKVTTNSKERALEQGMKHFKKKGFKVHSAEHVGMMHEAVSEMWHAGDSYKREFKRREMEHELGHEDRAEKASANSSHAVHINGKKWKSFGSQSHAQNVANKIKGATVHKEEVEIDEGSGPKEKQTSKYVDRTSAESKAKVQAAKDRMVSDKKAEAGKALLSKLKKEEVELEEAHKLGSPVEVIKGSGKGIKGHIGEIRHGAYTGAPKTYTVYHGEHDAIQVPKEHIRAMKEEVELDEVLDPSMGAGEYVKDFQKSKAPQFKNKSKEKRRMMGIAAYLQAKRSAVSEELKGKQHKIDKNKNGKVDAHDFKLLRKEEEQIDELSTKTLAAAAHAASDPESDYAYGKSHDAQKFADHAKKKKDAKSAAAVQGAADAKGHYPRDNHTQGYDKLSHRTPSRVTAAGKANKQDTNALKNKLKEEEQMDEKISTAQMGHAGKTTIKHIDNPGVVLRMAAHDVKPGIKGYRDRIALLKAAQAQGKLKEEIAEEIDEEIIYELSKSTLGNYIKKSSNNAVISRKIAGDFEHQGDRARSPGMKAGSQVMSQKYKEKSWKRKDGIIKAVDRLTKEEIELNEANHREFAQAGKMHPDMAKHMKTGQEMDFYHSKTGDKISGMVTKNTGTAVHVQANKGGKVGGGETHKFAVSKNLGGTMHEGTEMPMTYKQFMEAMWPGSAEYKKKYDTERVTGAGARHDIKDTGRGVIATRRFSDNDTAAEPTKTAEPTEKRGRGRPAGSSGASYKARTAEVAAAARAKAAATKAANKNK